MVLYSAILNPRRSKSLRGAVLIQNPEMIARKPLFDSLNADETSAHLLKAVGCRRLG